MTRPLRPNRRGTARRAIGLECQVVRERDFVLVAERTEDLSTTGARVRAGRDVLTGEALIVSFRLPRSTHWIDVEATVARVSHGRRRRDRGSRSLGVVFDTLGADAVREIDRALRGVPFAA